MNALTDAAIIEELYAASQEGAQVDVVVRGICALRPGVEGLSENIRVRSILGRFLEHSRLYNFETDEHTLYLIGSADLMPRNLDHRIEIVVPVLDPKVPAGAERGPRRRSSADNASAWVLGPDGAWERLQPPEGRRAPGRHSPS